MTDRTSYIHISDSAGTECVQCGFRFPPGVARHRDLDPGGGVAQDEVDLDVWHFFTPEQWPAEGDEGPYVLCPDGVDP
jgi:hypothetical protein